MEKTYLRLTSNACTIQYAFCCFIILIFIQNSLFPLSSNLFGIGNVGCDPLIPEYLWQCIICLEKLQQSFFKFWNFIKFHAKKIWIDKFLCTTMFENENFFVLKFVGPLNGWFFKSFREKHCSNWLIFRKEITI